MGVRRLQPFSGGTYESHRHRVGDEGSVLRALLRGLRRLPVDLAHTAQLARWFERWRLAWPRNIPDLVRLGNPLRWSQCPVCHVRFAPETWATSSRRSPDARCRSGSTARPTSSGWRSARRAFKTAANSARWTASGAGRARLTLGSYQLVGWSLPSSNGNRFGPGVLRSAGRVSPSA